MGIIKQTHQAEKEKRKMLGDRAENFKNEVVEIGRKYKMKIVPKFGKYGLELDIVCFGGIFKNFKKNEFRQKIANLARSYGMTIVPIFGKYNLETEIQVNLDRDPNKNK